MYDHAGHLNDDYVSSLSDIVNQDVPSVEESVASFLAFIARKVESSAVLACIFRQFETDFLHGNEIHAVAAMLTSDQHLKSTFIKHYYN